MAHRDHETPVWIGFADFLMTLAILFFVFAVGIAARANSGPAHLVGVVRDSASHELLNDCPVRVGPGRETRTGKAGAFIFRVDGLSSRFTIDLDVTCPGYGQYRNAVTLHPGDTTRVNVLLNADGSPRPDSDTTLSVHRIPGDVAFERNDYRLTDQGIRLIRQIGLAFRDSLRAGEVIAVQGHTDDLPFPAGAGKDNWILSGERASSAAKVLTDAQYGVGISPCRVVIMGFGPSRPIEAVQAKDSRVERAHKRERNRRIEFRTLAGTDVSGAECHDP